MTRINTQIGRTLDDAQILGMDYLVEGVVGTLPN